jgi:hypothetical protein
MTFAAVVLSAVLLTPPSLKVAIDRPVPVTETELVVKVTPPDGLYDVTITPKAVAPKGEHAYWAIYPRKSVVSLERDNAHWRLKLKPGTYEVSYTTYINGEQMDSFNEFTVGDGPGPGPGPGPVDPPVNDPDYAKVKAAYDSDTPTDAGLRKLNAVALVKYYRDAASVCNTSTATTVGAFFNEINVKAQSERVGLSLPKVRNDVVAAALRNVFPAPTDGALVVSDVQRKSLGAAFTKYANLLEAASK